MLIFKPDAQYKTHVWWLIIEILDLFPGAHNFMLKPHCVASYSRFKNLYNRKAARTKSIGVVNSIRHRQQYWNSLYSNTRVVFKVV